MTGERQDTNPGMDLQQAILDELQKLRKSVDGLNESVEEMNDRVGGLERRVEEVVRDLNTVHTLQRTYTQRLAGIEQMCVDQPLETAKPSPVPSPTRKKISVVPDGSGR